MEGQALPYESGTIILPEEELETFPCGICSKVFYKKPSRNRHRLYCRKKSQLNQPARKRPCLACRQAKTRCNSALPRCARCIEKERGCVYDGKLHRDSTTVSVSPNSLQYLESDDRIVEPSSEIDLLGVGYGPGAQSFGRNELYGSSTTWSSPSTGPFENIATPGSDGFSFLTSDFNLGLVSEEDFFQDQHHMQNMGWCDANPTTPPTILTVEPGIFISETKFFDSPYLKLIYLTSLHGSVPYTSAISRRQSPFIQTSRNFGSQLGHGFLLQNIRSFANMILDPRNPPPFIHMSALPGDRSEPIFVELELEPTESLAICQSIVQMYTTKTKQNSGFFWRTIASEQKRVQDQYPECDEWSVATMLQALTIYILLRIFDGDSFTVDYDNQLVQTMTAVAIKSEESGFLCKPETIGELPNWTEWVLMESKRRTVTLLFIIHLLFDINPGQRAKALTGLSQLPLPAIKPIWHATTGIEWKKHYNASLQSREGRSALVYNDLLLVNQQSNDSRMKDLNNWFINIDAFGMLVMMAATAL